MKFCNNDWVLDRQNEEILDFLASNEESQQRSYKINCSERELQES